MWQSIATGLVKIILGRRQWKAGPMPIYTPPNFNYPMNRWFAGHTPASNPPDVTGQRFQIYVYSRLINFSGTSGTTQQLPFIIIREPVGASTHAQVGDILSDLGLTGVYPVGYYKVFFKQAIHMGFPNEYIALWSVQCASNGTVPKHPQP